MSNNQLIANSKIRANLASPGRHDSLGCALDFLKKTFAGDCNRAKEEFKSLQNGMHEKRESPCSSIVFFKF